MKLNKHKNDIWHVDDFMNLKLRMATMYFEPV